MDHGQDAPPDVSGLPLEGAHLRRGQRPLPHGNREMRNVLEEFVFGQGRAVEMGHVQTQLLWEHSCWTGQTILATIAIVAHGIGRMLLHTGSHILYGRTILAPAMGSRVQASGETRLR